MITNKHGGAGRGQGRKPLDPSAKTVKRNVTLLPSQVEAMEKLGDGNLSAGIRKAIENMTTHRFATSADAISAGYRTATGGKDKDISNPNHSAQGSYGYDYQDAEGNKTVSVTLTEETNRMGHGPLHVAMFPPNKNE